MSPVIIVFLIIIFVEVFLKSIRDKKKIQDMRRNSNSIELEKQKSLMEYEYEEIDAYEIDETEEVDEYESVDYGKEMDREEKGHETINAGDGYKKEIVLDPKTMDDKLESYELKGKPKGKKKIEKELLKGLIFSEILSEPKSVRNMRK